MLLPALLLCIRLMSGAGAYFHGFKINFSASDNSDVLTNGRRYTARLQEEPSLMAIRSVILPSLLALLFWLLAYRAQQQDEAAAAQQAPCISAEVTAR